MNKYGDNEHAEMTCHVAVHNMANNKAEEWAKQCAAVCAGRLAIMQRVIGGSLIGQWKNVK